MGDQTADSQPVAFPEFAVDYFDDVAEPLYMELEDGDIDCDALESITTDETGELRSFVTPFPATEGGRVERDDAPDIIETPTDCGAWFGIRHADAHLNEGEALFRVVKLTRNHVTTDRYKWSKGTTVIKWSAYDMPLIPKAWDNRHDLRAHVADKIPMKIIGKGERGGDERTEKITSSDATGVRWFEYQYERLFYPTDELGHESRYETLDT